MNVMYFLVKGKKAPNQSFWDSHHVFVSVFEGKLEHLTGDRIIFSLLKLKEGQPIISERAQLQYDIIPFKDKVQYEFYRADSEGRTCGSGEIRTYRDPNTKTIFVGEI